MKEQPIKQDNPNQVHLKPLQTDRMMMRINKMRIPKTINLIFMFWNHIFLLILVPCCLKSCAWNSTILDNPKSNPIKYKCIKCGKRFKGKHGNKRYKSKREVFSFYFATVLYVCRTKLCTLIHVVLYLMN